MQRSYQFTVARRNDQNELEELPNMLTPVVVAETPTEAIYSAQVVQYCQTNECVVYRRVG